MACSGYHPVAGRGAAQPTAPPAAAAVQPPPGHGPALARATGMLMAAVPCSAREAARILQTAAARARLTTADVALALVASARGASVPARPERALRQAVLAARADRVPQCSAGTFLLPAPDTTGEALARLRTCRDRLADAPDDAGAVQEMDDAAYTVCVLMGQPSLPAALAAAEHRMSRPG